MMMVIYLHPSVKLQTWASVTTACNRVFYCSGQPSCRLSSCWQNLQTTLLNEQNPLLLTATIRVRDEYMSTSCDNGQWWQMQLRTSVHYTVLIITVNFY